MLSVLRLSGLVVFGILVFGCRTDTPRFGVRGRVGQDRIETRVDSELARAYVHALTGTPLDQRTNDVIKRVLLRFDGLPLSKQVLAELGRATSPDFASLYFAQRVSVAHAELKRRFAAYTDVPASVPASLSAGVVAVFVPGLFYQSHPETKGDLVDAERVVRSLGVATDRVKTLDAGSVEENAAILSDFIRNYKDKRARLVLVSASKGGPEVLSALGKLTTKDSGRVAGWVSIGGVLRGSPLADEWLTVPKNWGARVVSCIMGFSPDLLSSLATQQSSARLDATKLPPNLVILHYVGVPLSGTVSNAVWNEYKQLSLLGPNDGITLLSDELLPGGRVVVDLGLDHRFVHPQIAEKTAALTRLVLEMLPSDNP